jgi:two-component system NtrC family sensor kinase
MVKPKAEPEPIRPPAILRPRDYDALAQRILRSAGRESSRQDFLREVAAMVLDFAACDAVELQVTGDRHPFACVAAGDMPVAEPDELPSPATTAAAPPGRYRSTVAVSLTVAEETIGTLRLLSRNKNYFPTAEAEHWESIGRTLGLSLVNQSAQASLRERVKELTCLYAIAQLAEEPELELHELLGRIAALLPPAWQYPEITAARITFDGEVFAAGDVDSCLSRQSAPLMIKDQQRGLIEVGYTAEKPTLDEGPFLAEERNLIEGVARQVSLMIERRQAAEDRGRLQVQLRHADRLATIGQLSAGVAHEINEPLSNILAFAQLALKTPELPAAAVRDLEKIVATSLHAREIIKKLMLFARQMPPRKTRVNLNTLIEEGLYFLEARCMKDGVTVQRRLAPKLPEIVADPSQLNQVLVNLVVNAIQAMPGGGLLKITTRALNDQVAMTVEDNGEGMPPRVLKRIFVPFFTTKDVHEGTGLGLSVVHGIVTAHGGTIDVESTPGRGSRFEVRLPLSAADDQSSPAGER